MSLNYGPEKNLILEMETENHEIHDNLTITPNGLLNSSRIKKDDDTTTYFGYKSEEKSVIQIFYFYQI